MKHQAVALGLISSTFAATVCFAANNASSDDMQKALDEMARLRAQNEQIAAANAELAAKIARLEERAAHDTDWLTEQRAAEIRAIVTDVVADSATRTSLSADGASAGWDKSRNFFIASADGNYTLGIKGDMQYRWSLDHRNIGGTTAAAGSSSATTNENAWGFEIRRLRIEFFGNVVDPSWTFDLKSSFNRNAVSGNSGYLDDAWVQKDFGGGYTLRIGQFKAPFMREELVSTDNQLAVERSLVNDMFTVARAQGLRLGWNDDKVRIEGFYGDALRANATEPYALTGTTAGALNAGSALGEPTSQNTGFNQNQVDYAFAGRVEWAPGGDWKIFKDFTSFRGEGSGLLLGAAGYIEQAVAVPSVNNATPDVIWSTSADATYNFGGATLFAYGVYRNVTLQGAQPTRSGGTSDTLHQWGALIQGGTFVSDDVELFARYEMGSTDTDQFRTAATATLANGEDLSFATVGCNWWPAGSKQRAIKFTTDFGYAFDPLVDFASNGVNTLPDYTASGGATNDGQWVVRSQLVFLF